MKRTLGIASVVIVLLAFADIATATISAIRIGEGTVGIPDGGAGGLVLMFVAGGLLKLRERY